MTKVMVVGAGRQGVAAAHCLVHTYNCDVWLVDKLYKGLAEAEKLCGDKVTKFTQNIEKDDLAPLIRQVDCVVSAVPYSFNYKLAMLALEHKKHFCDLGGHVPTVKRQLNLSDHFKGVGCTMLPDCGIAPGTLNVLAEYWKATEQLEYSSVKIMCGGLPKEPSNAFKYEAAFSVHGLFNEYLSDCEVSRGGMLEIVEGLGELEEVDKLLVSGKFEAFATSGGASLAPRLYAEVGIDYEYKTLRYPGHQEIIIRLRDMGLLDNESSIKGMKGTTMRDLMVQAMEKTLVPSRDDIMLAQIIVHGKDNQGRDRIGIIDFLDHADDTFTAMERTTGFSLAYCAAYCCGLTGDTVQRGAFAPFQVLSPRNLLDFLTNLDMEIQVRGLTQP